MITNPKWLIYPYLGVGVNYARLTVSSVVSNLNFQNSLANLGVEEVEQRNYRTDGLMLFGEIGVGVERVLVVADSDLFVGLSGGYRLSTSNAWTLGSVKIYEATFGTQGWVFQLIIRAEDRPDRARRNRGLLRFFK